MSTSSIFKLMVAMAWLSTPQSRTTIKRVSLEEGVAQREYEQQKRMNAGKLEKQRRLHELKTKRR